jgi:hypothetical protein
MNEFSTEMSTNQTSFALTVKPETEASSNPHFVNPSIVKLEFIPNSEECQDVFTA